MVSRSVLFGGFLGRLMVRLSFRKPLTITEGRLIADTDQLELLNYGGVGNVIAVASFDGTTAIWLLAV